MDHASSQRIIKNVNYSFYSALAVVVLVIILYFASLYSQKWINHTNEVKAQIYRVNETLLRSESLQRGYLITRDQDYRIDYKVSIKQIDEELKNLQEKTIDNQTMQGYMERLKPLIEERVRVMDNNLETFVVSTAEKNRGYKDIDKIKKLIIEIDDIRDAMLIEENRLLKERKSTYDTIYKLSLFVLTLGIALMVYSLFMLRKRLIPLFTTLENQNDNLEAALKDRDAEIKLKEDQMHLNEDLILQLEEKNVQLNQFAYIASHDLQEPLRTVDNFIDLFEEDYGDNLDSNAEQYFKFIKGATSRMNALITGLLNYSRLGRSGSKSKVELPKLLEGIKSDFGTIIQDKNALITSDVLPTVTGYPVELRQLFANLISNALKFTPPDRQPKVHVSVKESSQFYTFQVKDNGLGIKESHLSKIFNMFTRLHSAKEYKGTGIGLAFCQKIVDLHRGKISVTSELGEGSIFTFSLKK